MSKIELDKYYTSDELAKYCVKKTKEIIGDENITEYLEPSAGAGVFLKYLKDKPYQAYDIKPEGTYCLEYFIKVNNNTYKDRVIELIKNTRWDEIYPMLLKSKIINKWQIYKYIKEQIPEIE